MTTPVAQGGECIAALSICELLLLSLTDLGMISQKDVRGLLEDVATTHEEAAAASQETGDHRAVVEIVLRILTGQERHAGVAA
jgi:hypothetical protein